MQRLPIIADDYEEMSRYAAIYIARQVLKCPDSVLGLPTGNTPAGMYRILVSMFREGLVDFSRTGIVMLDEFRCLPPEDPRAFQSYVRRNFLDHVNAPANRVLILSALHDSQEACAKHDRAIEALGGIDLQVLGIGRNGHIAFNEPGSLWNATTHLVKLTPETRSQHAEEFGSIGNVPDSAITVGIATIMRARRVLLLASGTEKAEVVARAIEGPVTREIPASVLQLHPTLDVVVSEDAGRLLKRTTKWRPPEQSVVGTIVDRWGTDNTPSCERERA